MNRLFIIFISLLLSISTYAQPNVNKKDEQGRKTGKWLSYYPGGKKKYEGTFRDGYEIGTFKYWTGNGILKSELSYSQKGEYADAKIYYNNGIVQAEGRFHNRKKDSIWNYYTKIPHILQKEEGYKDGVKHGPWRVYYRNGQLSSEIYWKDGKRDGEWNDYYEDGVPHVKAHFKDGKLEGEYKLFSTDSVLIKKGVYVDGKMEGVWKIYDDNGDLSRKERFTKGVMQEEANFSKGKLTSYKNYTRIKFKDDFKDAK